jgi:hypothetical protein
MKATLKYLPFIFFIWVFLLSFRPLKDFDVWWHIKTGQWIVENHKIPIKEDPFSYASTKPINPVNAMTTQWLGDVVFYASYATGGLAGVSLLRGILLAAPFFFLYLLHLRKGPGPFFSFSYLCLPASILVVNLNYTYERPQAFSFVFAMLLTVMLEDYRENRGKKILLAAPLMALWSNMHGSYVIGDVILILYSASETLKRLFGAGGSMEKRHLSFMASASAAAFASSFINPNAYKVLYMFAARSFSAGGGGGSSIMIAEWLNLWRFREAFGAELWPLFAAGFIVISVCPLVLTWIKRRAVDITELFVVSLASAIGLFIARGIMFSFLLLPVFFVKSADMPRKAFSVIALAVCILWMSNSAKFNFDFVPNIPENYVDERFPQGAVDFLKENNIDAPVFGYREWGGYLIFNGYKTFTDPRLIDLRINGIYETAISCGEGWEGIIDSYGINAVLIPAIVPSQNSAVALALELARAGRASWRLIYFKDNSVVFLRDIPENRHVIEKYRIPEWMLFKDLLLWADSMLYHAPENKDMVENLKNIRSVAELRLREFPGGGEFIRKIKEHGH